nr:MAG TPA: hypothetical protein [Caudoviricetes sp.]
MHIHKFTPFPPKLYHIARKEANKKARKSRPRVA